jgi:hypothetical protein
MARCAWLGFFVSEANPGPRRSVEIGKRILVPLLLLWWFRPKLVAGQISLWISHSVHVEEA